MKFRTYATKTVKCKIPINLGVKKKINLQDIDFEK